MSGHTHQKLSNGIVTSDAIHNAKNRSRTWLVVAALVFIPTALIVLGLYAYFLHHNTRAQIAIGITSAEQGTMTAQQQLDAAVANASAQLGESTTSMQKAEAYKELGAAYFNKGDYNNAIAAYNNAIHADNSVKPEVLDTLAYTYATAGQRDKAITVYQELISRLQQQSNAGHEARNYQGGNSIQTYQQDIQTLQQGGTI